MRISEVKDIMRSMTAFLFATFVILMVPSCGVEQASVENSEPEKVTTLGLEYEAVDAAVGDQVEVIVQVGNVSDLYGVALDVVYDPAVYKFVSAAKDDFLASDGRDINFAAALEDGYEGRLVMGVSRIGDVDGLAGTGAVMTARFELLCKDCGETELKLDKTYLKNPELTDIPFETVSNET